MTDKGNCRFAITDEGRVARITLSRPQARNALTFAMYEQLVEAFGRVEANPDLRAAVLQGEGDSFAAGTDIREFRAFTRGEDGVAYEDRVEAVIGRLERLSVPTVAAIDGAAMGGGLILAASCDIRIVTGRALLGVPIARTLGNCLSTRNVARLVQNFGLARTRQMLLLAGRVEGPDAVTCGFAMDCVPPERLDETVEAVLSRLLAAAPLTIATSRQMLATVTSTPYAGDDELIARVYGSRDFHEGVAAFLEKRKPKWQGV